MAKAAACAWLHPGRHPRALHVHLDPALRYGMDDAAARDSDVHSGGPQPAASAASGRARAWWGHGHALRFRSPAFYMVEPVPGVSALSLRRHDERGGAMESPRENHSVDCRDGGDPVLLGRACDGRLQAKHDKTRRPWRACQGTSTAENAHGYCEQRQSHAGANPLDPRSDVLWLDGRVLDLHGAHRPHPNRADLRHRLHARGGPRTVAHRAPDGGDHVRLYLPFVRSSARDSMAANGDRRLSPANLRTA